MGRQSRRQSIIGITAVALAVFAAALSGCAAGRPPITGVEARARYGTIGVIALPEPPATAFERPATSRGEAAGRGVVLGFGIPLLVGFQAAGPPGMLMGMLASPVTMVAGGICGVFAVTPPEDVERAASALDAAVSASQIAERVRDGLVERLRLAGIDAVVLDAAAPGLTVDTIVEIKASEIALFGVGIDPDLSLRLSVVARAIREGSEIRSSTRTFDSGPRRHTFESWAKADATPLRLQVTTAIGWIANRIGDDLLNPSPEVTSSVGHGVPRTDGASGDPEDQQ